MVKPVKLPEFHQKLVVPVLVVKHPQADDLMGIQISLDVQDLFPDFTNIHVVHVEHQPEHQP